MNRKQKMCLLVSITVIVAMGLYPPWVLERKSRLGKDKFIIEAGPYSWINDPPVKAAETRKYPNPNKYSSERYSTTIIRYEARAKFIDLYRLGVQFFVVAVVTAGLIVILRGRKRS